MLCNYKQLMVWQGVALLALVVCAPVAFGQQSVTTYTLDTPVTNQLVTNECNGDTVIMNGTMHFEYFFSIDADGDHTHYHISSTSHLTGVGSPSGANYVANDTVHQNVTTRGEASDTTMALKSKLVAQGKTPDMMLRQSLHVVVDRNNNIKAEVVKNTVTCK